MELETEKQRKAFEHTILGGGFIGHAPRSSTRMNSPKPKDAYPSLLTDKDRKNIYRVGPYDDSPTHNKERKAKGLNSADVDEGNAFRADDDFKVFRAAAQDPSSPDYIDPNDPRYGDPHKKKGLSLSAEMKMAKKFKGILANARKTLEEAEKRGERAKNKEQPTIPSNKVGGVDTFTVKKTEILPKLEPSDIQKKRERSPSPKPKGATNKPMEPGKVH